MILTDVGLGSEPADGALVIISDFISSAADGIISVDEQARIEGANTFLGNPVDVAYDEFSSMIFIAERANNGGRVLGFSLDDEGDVSPMYDEIYPGASAVFSDNFGVISSIVNLGKESLDINVFPNPTTSVLSVVIEGDLEIYNDAIVTVTTIDSKVVMQTKMNASTKSVDVTPLGDGMYVLNIRNERFSHSSRFIKVK